MGFLRDAAIVAIGAAVSDLTHKDKAVSAEGKSLEEMVDEFASRHGITCPDQEFYCQLVKIAEGYHNVYEDDDE